jgi:heme exporter protein A
MPDAIAAQSIAKRFGTRNALDGLSLVVPEGAFISIFGPNGAGKTTLLRVLSTMARPTDGALRVLGMDASEEPDAIRARIGIISHEPMVYPDLTALENLEFFAGLYGVRDPHARALELLDAVGLKHRRFDAAGTFSRGMTQRLAIARALVHDPELLFLDEPYSGLDPHAVAVFDEPLASIREGRTFVMVSHDMDKGLELCSHALVMEKGRSVLFAPREELDRESFRTLYLETVGRGVS